MQTVCRRQQESTCKPGLHSPGLFAPRKVQLRLRQAPGATSSEGDHQQRWGLTPHMLVLILKAGGLRLVDSLS